MKTIMLAAAAAMFSGAALAQPSVKAPMPPPPLIDWAKIEIKATDLGNNTWMLAGQGGNITIAVGTDAIIMVDGQFAPLSDKIKAAIKAISPLPIKYLVNTHFHGDHTGGNENFAKLGATLLTRPQLRSRLAGGQRPAPPGALAIITYDNTISLHMNGEEVQLIPVRTAHTDGDTMIRFVKSDVIFTGDFYRAVGYPYPDRANGGSVQGLIDGLQQLVDAAGPNTKIVPGHGPVVNKTDVAAHRQMAIAVRDKVAALAKQGTSADAAVAAKPTADYDAKVPQGPQTSERFIRAIVAEATGGR
jgi:cyclase